MVLGVPGTGVQLRECGSLTKCNGEGLDCGDNGWLLEPWCGDWGPSSVELYLLVAKAAGGGGNRGKWALVGEGDREDGIRDLCEELDRLCRDFESNLLELLVLLDGSFSIFFLISASSRGRFPKSYSSNC